MKGGQKWLRINRRDADCDNVLYKLFIFERERKKETSSSNNIFIEDDVCVACGRHSTALYKSFDTDNFWQHRKKMIETRKRFAGENLWLHFMFTKYPKNKINYNFLLSCLCVRARAISLVCCLHCDKSVQSPFALHAQNTTYNQVPIVYVVGYCWMPFYTNPKYVASRQISHQTVTTQTARVRLGKHSNAKQFWLWHIHFSHSSRVFLCIYIFLLFCLFFFLFSFIVDDNDKCAVSILLFAVCWIGTSAHTRRRLAPLLLHTLSVCHKNET